MNVGIFYFCSTNDQLTVQSQLAYDEQLELLVCYMCYTL